MIALLAIQTTPDLVSQSKRTITYANPAEEIQIVDVESVRRVVTSKDAQWNITETRTFLYSKVGDQKVPGDAKPIVTQFTYPYQNPAKPTDPFAARSQRLYAALFARQPVVYPAQLGGLPEARVTFPPGKPPAKFRYEEPDFVANGTVHWNEKTRLPAQWQYVARNVPLPGGDLRADLTVTEEPETK
jgi:hypothetical protein